MIKFWNSECRRKAREIKDSFSTLRINLENSLLYFSENRGRLSVESLKSDKNYYLFLLGQIEEMDEEYSGCCFPRKSYPDYNPIMRLVIDITSKLNQDPRIRRHLFKD